MFRISGPFKAALLIIFTLCCALSLNAAAPKGWFLTGSSPADYETGVDSQVIYNDHGSAFLKSIKASPQGFGTLMQEIGPSLYQGKRIRFSAHVKSENVQGWAGLWLRIDKGSVPVGFDNMEKRAIKGTTGWQRYEVVLDVPNEATGIAFGALLTGAGSVWLNSAKIEVVGTDVSTTGLPEPKRPSEPVNLSFDN